MKRKGIHKPTCEDAIEISGVETLHPGGFELTKRTAQLCNLQKGLKVLDVSSGRGTQAIYYGKVFNVHVTGLDISKDMVDTATQRAKDAGMSENVKFVIGDSQNLPFESNTFDVVINECAVGIPDDSQKVLDEMYRVVKPQGAIAIHETTFRKQLSESKKEEISERLGTTPLELHEWNHMLEKAGISNIISESDKWSKPNMFWEIRKDRHVSNYKQVLSFSEKIRTAYRIYRTYGFKGVYKAYQNGKLMYESLLNGDLGYALFKGVKL